MTQQPRTRTRTFLALGAALGLCILGSPTASAAPGWSWQLDDGFSEAVDDFCGEEGLTVDIESRLSGWEGFKSNGLYASHGTIDESYTANGITFTSHSKVNDKDLHVLDPGDGTLVITILSTGNATLYGPDGKGVARNPGQVRALLTIDAETGEELGFEQIKESTGRSDDACAVMVAAFTA
jgi:hypothetical protein